MEKSFENFEKARKGGFQNETNYCQFKKIKQILDFWIL